jgi:riboflavin kinase/FMN adenylyltransferase
MEYKGIVIGGSRKAEALGFPTANIGLTDTKATGIYIATVTIEGKEYPAVAYADQERKILEAHLFDFSQNLYEKEISVALEKKLRESEWFDDEVKLKEAVAQDIAMARAYFKK